MSRPWWLTEKGYKARLAEARNAVAKKHESKAKRLLALTLIILLGALVLLVHLWKGFVRLKRRG